MIITIQSDKPEYTDGNMILETERLYLREMKQSDFNSSCKMFGGSYLASVRRILNRYV